MTPFQQEAMQAVRDTISAVLAGKPVPKFEFKDPRFAEHSGVFVTLKLHGDLRGCIGLIEGIKPLGQALPEMAAAAAFQDPRFRPLSAAEWPECKLDISVLTPLSRVASISELEVGKHGLLLRHQGRSGVLLPQVPVEQGWDLDTFLEQLCYKAGLPPGSHLHGHLYKFSAEVFGDAEH